MPVRQNLYLTHIALQIRQIYEFAYLPIRTHFKECLFQVLMTQIILLRY